MSRSIVNQTLFDDCIRAIGNDENIISAINLYLVIIGVRKGARLELSDSIPTSAFESLWKKDLDRLEQLFRYTDEDKRLLDLLGLNSIHDAQRFIRICEFCEKHRVIALRNQSDAICIQRMDRRNTIDLQRHLLAKEHDADYLSFTALARFLEYPRLTESEFEEVQIRNRRSGLMKRETHVLLRNGRKVHFIRYVYTKKKSLDKYISGSRVSEFLCGLVIPGGEQIEDCVDIDQAW